MEQVNLNEQFLAASSSGNIEAAVEALSAGADLNAVSLKGNNALYLSATRSRYDFFEWVLEVTQKGKSIDLNNKNAHGDTLLLELVREKTDISFIKDLLEAGAKVDLPSRDGVTALLQACANGEEEVAQVMLEHGANPNIFVQENRTNPFLMAIAEGNFDLVKLLEGSGADFNAVDRLGRNALLSALFRPMQYLRKHEKKSHLELLDYLVESNINLDYVSPAGASAIWLTTLMGHDNLTLKLMEKGVSVNRMHEIDAKEGKTSVLHNLCKAGNPDLVDMAITKGARLDVLDGQRNSPAGYGFMNPMLVDVMLKHNADVNTVVNIPDPDSNKPMHKMPVFARILTEGDKSLELIEEMVRRGAKLHHDDKEQSKWDPMVLSIGSSSIKVMEFLLKHPDTDINRVVYNDRGLACNYLSLACVKGNKANVQAIVEQKLYFENLMKAKKENDKNGVQSQFIDEEGFKKVEASIKAFTEIEEAADNQTLRMIKFLVDNGIDMEWQDESGKTALFFCRDAVRAKLLTDAGANIYHQDEEGNNPLTTAILQGKKDLIDFYKSQYSSNLDNMYYRMAFNETAAYSTQKTFEQGIIHFAGGEELKNLMTPQKGEDLQRQNIAHINYQDPDDGNTALLVASATNNPSLASLYYQFGADINLANHLGETPLMHAIASKNGKFVEFLIKNGADCSAVTTAGKSVLDFAIESDKLDIIKAIHAAKNDDKDMDGVKKEVKKMKP